MLIPVLAVALNIASASSNSPNLLRASDPHFSAENDGVKNAVPIPDGVWSLLKQDADVQRALDYQSPPLKAPPEPGSLQLLFTSMEQAEMTLWCRAKAQ